MTEKITTFTIIEPSRRMCVFAELTLTLRQTIFIRTKTLFLFCHDYQVLIRRSVEWHIICHSTENISNRLFLRPDFLSWSFVFLQKIFLTRNTITDCVEIMFPCTVKFLSFGTDKAWANSADPDQKVPIGAVWSGLTLFAIPATWFGRMGVC